MQLRRPHGSVLLFKLASSFTLLTLNSLTFLQGQHLLVLNSELAALQFIVVQGIYDCGCLIG